MSRAAFERLTAELDDLTTRGRIEVALKIERAREEGDLRENAGYHAAKDEQGHMEGRIRQLEHMIEHAEILADQFVYTIVFDGDTDDMAERYVVGHVEDQVEGASVVSVSSPLGAALQGAEAGQHVTYSLKPDGGGPTLTVKVLAVEKV